MGKVTQLRTDADRHEARLVAAKDRYPPGDVAAWAAYEALDDALPTNTPIGVFLERLDELRAAFREEMADTMRRSFRLVR